MPMLSVLDWRRNRRGIAESRDIKQQQADARTLAQKNPGHARKVCSTPNASRIPCWAARLDSTRSVKIRNGQTCLDLRTVPAREYGQATCDAAFLNWTTPTWPKRFDFQRRILQDQRRSPVLAGCSAVRQCAILCATARGFLVDLGDIKARRHVPNVAPVN
jgi:hypothetical protein